MPHAKYKSFCDLSKFNFGKCVQSGSTDSVATYKTLSVSKLSKYVKILGCRKVFKRFTADFAISNCVSELL